MSSKRALAAVCRRLGAERISTHRRYLRGLVELRGAHDWATREAREPLSREEMDRRRAWRKARGKPTGETTKAPAKAGAK